MKIHIFDTPEALFERLAQYFATEITKNPSINLGLATGSTPVPLYKKLIEDHRINGTSYRHVKTFNLDEYLGLSRNSPDTYKTFMKKEFFDHIDIRSENTHIPSSDLDSANYERLRYDKIIKNNPIDIQLLGIGTNAHIGFNEDGSNFDNKTMVVDLKQSTLEENAKFFDSMEDVPKQAITMGIGTIMKAKKIVLVATGLKKADAIRDTIKGYITKDVPASILQTHENVVIYLDKEAASKL